MFLIAINYTENVENSQQDGRRLLLSGYRKYHGALLFKNILYPTDTKWHHVTPQRLLIADIKQKNIEKSQQESHYMLSTGYGKFRTTLW